MISILVSCSPARHTHNSEQDGNNVGDHPKILFLDYQITRDSTRTNYTAQLINMIITEGSIKDVMQKSFQPENNDLKLLVLDKNHQAMIHHHIPNPLDKSVEYVNDAGQFERKMIHLDSAQFSVRLQIESDAESILLNRIHDEDKEGTLLLKTTIR